MKVCSKCKKKRHDCKFSKDSQTKSGLRCTCKDCTNKAASVYRMSKQCKDNRNIWYKEIQKPARNKYMQELKVNGCAICGYNECSRALQFHHVNSQDKKFCICKHALTSKSVESLGEEIVKCILLCANCHAEIHDREK